MPLQLWSGNLQRLPNVNRDRTGLMPDDKSPHSGSSADVDRGLVCDHPSCGSKVFKHKGDLTRHKKLHEQKRNFPCMARECSFTFTRNDKMMDHIRAGHEAEDLFACPGCSMLLTRDILPLHRHQFRFLNKYRQCPFPKCNFRTRTSSSAMDSLRDHLLKDHGPKVRKTYASLLASRGYDHESANIVCPVCTEGTAFDEHKKFGLHFLEMHCPNLSADDLDPWCDRKVHPVFEGRSCEQQGWGTITDEQRKHRRTIFSLLPAFGGHPVWNDIRYGRCD